MADEQISVGDVVRHVDPQGLHCSTSIYGAAVVASLDPVRLVSVSGDMVWHHQELKNLVRVGRAPIYAWANVFDRMRRSGEPIPHIPGTEEQVRKGRDLYALADAAERDAMAKRREAANLGYLPDSDGVAASENTSPMNRNGGEG